jgi:hypothetical protein
MLFEQDVDVIKLKNVDKLKWNGSTAIRAGWCEEERSELVKQADEAPACCLHCQVQDRAVLCMAKGTV